MHRYHLKDRLLDPEAPEAVHARTYGEGVWMQSFPWTISPRNRDRRFEIPKLRLEVSTS